MDLGYLFMAHPVYTCEIFLCVIKVSVSLRRLQCDIHLSKMRDKLD